MTRGFSGVLVVLAILLGGCAQEHRRSLVPGGDATPSGDSGDRTVGVTAVEYKFHGVPETLEPGVTTFRLENEGEEHHEIVVALHKGGQSIEEILDLPEPGRFVEQAGTASASSGNTDELLTTLRPGLYGYACFVAAQGGTPHWSLGMFGEFTVA